MPTRRAVLFDMDDVLCAYDRPARIARLAAMAGRAPDLIESAIWGSGFEDAADQGWLSAEAYLAGFGLRIGYPLSRAEWIVARRASMRPFRDSLDLAARLKAENASVAVLTNNGFLTLETIDALFPALRPVFAENIFASAQFGLVKPDPTIFREACARLGIAPERAFFTDDQAINVEGARRAGLGGETFVSAERLESAIDRFLAGSSA